MKHAARGGNALPRRTHWSRGGRLVAMLGIASVLVTGTILGQSSDAAFAADYPSWSDVQAARNNVKAKDAELTRIDGLLASLASAVTSAQADAVQKGTEFQAAQQKLDEAQYKLNALQVQADAAKEKAEKSKQQAGQLAAQLARVGGGDLSATLFFGGDSTDDLLSQLGLASMVKDKSAGLYDKATQDQNSAQALTDQASVAKEALKKLAEAAQQALAEANAASEKAAAAEAEQEGNKSRLEAQRATLAGTQVTTEAGYNQGVAVAAAAAAKAAAEYAAAHPAPPASSGGGAPNSSGWVRPSAGHISSNYGMRVNPVYGGAPTLHAGTDLAPGCEAPIYAAHAGTVSFAGWSGGYGNFILINHGGGLSTGYGHIVTGGTLVHVGQAVSAGQQIARVGSTGNSTGCHLHFETRPGGVAVDAVPFMLDRGIRLG